MTLIKQYGGRLLAVFVFLMLMACSRNNTLSRKNIFHHQFMTTYTNDSLRVSVEFGGNFREKQLEDKAFRRIVKSKGIKIPQSLIFWGDHSVTTHRILVIGSIEQKFDSAHYIRKTSSHKSVYYSKTSISPRFISTDVYIPIKEIGYLKIRKIHCFKENEFPEDSNEYILNEERGYTNLVFETLMAAYNYAPAHKKTVHEITEEAFLSDSTGNYLLPLVNLQEDSAELSKRLFYDDYLKMYLSFIGNKVRYKRQDTVQVIEKWHEITIDSVINRIGKNQVVMFNERHINPACRILVAKTLQKLYNNGFRTLALEALFDDMESINKKEPISIKHGVYTREPHMANLIRTAQNIGFSVIGYENLDEAKEREFGQAENLYNKTIAQNNNLKCVVLAGGGHIDEVEDKNGKFRMAYYFKILSNINPLSINQVCFLDNASENKIELIEKPIKNENDIYLANGLNENCVFLGDNLTYHNLKFPIKKWGYEGDGLFQLYKKIDWDIDKTTVPVFIRKVSDLENIVVNIPSGYYLGLVKDQYNRVLFSKHIQINQNGEFK